MLVWILPASGFRIASYRAVPTGLQRPEFFQNIRKLSSFDSIVPFALFSPRKKLDLLSDRTAFLKKSHCYSVSRELYLVIPFSIDPSLSLESDLKTPPESRGPPQVPALVCKSRRRIIAVQLRLEPRLLLDGTSIVLGYRSQPRPTSSGILRDLFGRPVIRGWQLVRGKRRSEARAVDQTMAIILQRD